MLALLIDDLASGKGVLRAFRPSIFEAVAASVRNSEQPLVILSVANPRRFSSTSG
jgi:hypothetical protein